MIFPMTLIFPLGDASLVPTTTTTRPSGKSPYIRAVDRSVNLEATVDLDLVPDGKVPVEGHGAFRLDRPSDIERSLQHNLGAALDGFALADRLISCGVVTGGRGGYGRRRAVLLGYCHAGGLLLWLVCASIFCTTLAFALLGGHGRLVWVGAGCIKGVDVRKVIESLASAPI